MNREVRPEGHDPRTSPSPPAGRDDVARVRRSRQEARESYDRMSRWYDRLAGTSERRPREEALAMLGVVEGEAVLEVGCGTGNALVLLARAVGTSGRAVGVDLSPGMLAVARSRLARAACLAELHQADAARLPFPDDAFDAVFTSFTLELFDTPEIPLVLAECRRVLRPGGRIAVASLSREGLDRWTSRIMVRLYEWFHAQYEAWADCRPIHVERALRQAGFDIRQAALRTMWALPVELVVGFKTAAPPTATTSASITPTAS